MAMRRSRSSLTTAPSLSALLCGVSLVTGRWGAFIDKAAARPAAVVHARAQHALLLNADRVGTQIGTFAANTVGTRHLPVALELEPMTFCPVSNNERGDCGDGDRVDPMP